MLLYKQKKNQNQPLKGNRFLISVTVHGSAGPIRFVVNEDELVAAVMDTALKSYAREGRLPILGSDLNNFMFYCPITGTEGNWDLYAKSIDSIACWFVLFLFFLKKWSWLNWMNGGVDE